MNKLTIIGTPLGNIEDISLRAIEALKNAKLVLCEDTRQFHKLYQKLLNLGHLTNKFAGKLLSINDFNESFLINKAVELINQEGEALLLSDSGMPLVSDPGYKLVNQCLKEGITIDVIPGPTALTTALPLSGFSSDRVVFLGFLPKKSSKRNKALQELTVLKGTTIVFYQSPYRLKKTLIELQSIFNKDSKLAITKELTKMHQKVFYSNLGEIEQVIESKPKGEYTVLLRI